MKIWIAILFLAASSLLAQTNPDSTAQYTNAVVRNDSAIGSQINAAAMRGDIEKARALLADSPDYVFSKDQHGWTPLYWAAASGRKEVVQLLLANGADINALNQNFTPLRAAIFNHHPDVADLLIASNAQVTIFDAAAGGYVEILKRQLKTNAALVSATDDNGWTPLQFAARNGQLGAVKLLLANKADVNAGDRRGMTPLEAALAFSGGAGSDATNHEAIAELLLANGVKVTNQRSGSITALHYAASAGFTNVIKELLARHADVNAKDSNGRTPLDLAAQRGHMDVVELLVDRGAEMDAQDKAGLMALKEAEKKVQTRSASSAYEYEVDGLVNQTMIQFSGTNLHASASFTVYVRDCGWMIKTIETNEAGGIVAREIGSTNGTEIYECTHGLVGSGLMMGQIESGAVPVGELDSAVVGHLWLMFASECYWPSLNSDQLVPAYDWHASALAGGQNQRMSADWELLPGTNSLPREVRYLDALNHTNAIYTITGTNSVGGMLLPDGFVFKQFNGDRLIKHVEVEVTAIRPVCSRDTLIPLPSKGTSVVDARFDSGVPNRPPSYQNPLFGQWLSAEDSKKLAGINTSNTLRNLARAGISAFPKTRPPAFETNTSLPVLSLSIRCTNDVVKAGDEIDIEFRITNTGTNDYRYPNRTYDRSGRMPEYALVATNSSGKAVPDVFKPGGFGGGGFQYAMLKPGESFTKVIPLNCWALVKDPGRYEVAGFYGAEVVSNNPAVSPDPFITSIPISSAPIAVNVLPRTEAEMDAYISELTNQIASLSQKQIYPFGPYSSGSYGPTPQLDDLLEKLTYTCNSKIVPTMLDAMCLPGHGAFWESQALLNYLPHTKEIGKAIIATATAHGAAANTEYVISQYGFTNNAEIKPLIEHLLATNNPDDWAAGAGLAEKYSDDAFTPRLIAIAMTPRGNGRNAAITALAYNRTDEGVKTLKTLLNDPHEEIWTTLADAIINAYNWKDKPRGKPLRPDDFTAEDVKPLAEKMLASGKQVPDVMTGISLLQHFGSDDFTSQLIAIATDTENVAWRDAVYALAFNRTDAGVNTLRTLLNNPDPQIRKTVETAIRHAYTDRGNARGRPLKPEDFDQTYQQSEIKK